MTFFSSSVEHKRSHCEIGSKTKGLVLFFAKFTVFLDDLLGSCKNKNIKGPDNIAINNQQTNK